MENPQRFVLCLDPYLPTEHALDTYETSSQGGIIRIRVDWNGASNSLGTFQVQNVALGWDDVGNLSPESRSNDVCYTKPTQPVELHIQRGPTHGTTPFQAWARRIRWRQDPPPALGELAKDGVVVRQDDYEYVDSGIDVYSSELRNGFQTVRLPLELQVYDYELWVKLQHPTDVTRWSTIDPIVGHKDRGGTPAHRLSGTPTSDRGDTTASR